MSTFDFWFVTALWLVSGALGARLVWLGDIRVRGFDGNFERVVLFMCSVVGGPLMIFVGLGVLNEKR